MYRIISAHPRSGQNYISKVMVETGLRMGVGYARRDYNDPTDDGVVSFMHRIGAPGVIRLHQVREPLKTIASSMTESPGTYNRIFELLGYVPPYERMEIYYKRGRKHLAFDFYLPLWTWVHLNRFLEPKSEWTYRIEDIDDVYPRICEAFDVEPCDEVPDIDRRFNSRFHDKLEWEDLYECDESLAEQVKELAQKYGYNTDNTERIQVEHSRSEVLSG